MLQRSPSRNSSDSRQSPSQNSNTLRPLFRMFWIPILGLILGGAIGVFVSQLTTPSYQASVYLVVTPTSGTTSPDVGALANDYAQAFSRLVTEPAVVGSAINESDLGVDSDLNSIRGAVNVEVAPNAPILQITARSQDPRNASTLANTLGSALSSYTQSIEEEVGFRANLLSTAVPPENPVLPNTQTNMAVGAGAGLLAGVVIALLLDNLLRRRARRTEERNGEEATMSETIRDGEAATREK